MSSSWLRPAYQLGLDLQSDGIRLIKIAKFKQKMTVELAAFNPLPPNGLVDGGMKDWNELQLMLTKLVKEHDLYDLPVAICVPAKHIKIQSLILPTNLSDIEIETEIIMCMQREQPGLQDSLAIDFIKTSSSQTNSMNIHFYAARNQYIQNYSACINASGLKLKVVETDASAIQRMILSYLRLSLNKNELGIFIWLRNHDVVLNIFDAEKIIFYQQSHKQENEILQIMRGVRLGLATANQDKASVIFCGEESKKQDIFNGIINEWEFPTFYLNPANVFQQCAMEFLAALGAGMRKLPIW